MRPALALLACLAACASEGSAPAPELAIDETFDGLESLARFEFSDPAAWRWHPDGSLELFARSDYAPPQRSPHSIALLREPAFADFVLEAHLTQTGREYGHRDLCLFFGFQDPAHFYYVHLASTPDPRAHNIFLVDGAARRPLAEVPEEGVDWGTEQAHRVRLERTGDRIRVYFDDMRTPVLEAVDGTHGAGRVGFGSFDDTGRIDGLRIWAGSTRPISTAAFERS